jgi:hypothetical protein
MLMFNVEAAARVAASDIDSFLTTLRPVGLFDRKLVVRKSGAG